MRNYEDPKFEVMSANEVDIIKTSVPNQLDDADKNAGSTKYTWN